MLNKKTLDTDHIFPLLITLSIPTIIGGFATAFYNTIDSIFVGKYVSSNALAALTICNTIQTAFIALSALCGVGTGTLISQLLGAKEYTKIKQTLCTGVSGVFIGTSILSIFSLIFLDSILLFIGSTPEILYDAKIYMSMILWFGFVIPINGVLSSVLRAKGQANYAMILALVGAFLNIILDALFIVVFGWGVFGASFATVIAQIIVLILSLYYIKQHYNISFRDLYTTSIDLSIIYKILGIGAPSGMRLGVIVLVMLAANRTLQNYGIVALAAYGIVNRLISLAFMSMQGCNFGAQPIIAFNYGAKRLDRLNATLKKGSLIMLLIGFIGTGFFLFAPQSFFYIFTNDPEIAILTKEALSYTGSLFFLFGIYMLLSGFVQSVGYIKESLFLALFRPIFSIVLFYILPNLFGLYGIWLVMPVSDFINSILALVISIYVYRKIEKDLKQEELECQKV